MIEKGPLQYCKRKSSNEIRSQPCSVNLEKPRPCLTNMRILELVNTSDNN